MMPINMRDLCDVGYGALSGHCRRKRPAGHKHLTQAGPRTPPFCAIVNTLAVWNSAMLQRSITAVPKPGQDTMGYEIRSSECVHNSYRILDFALRVHFLRCTGNRRRWITASTLQGRRKKARGDVPRAVNQQRPASRCRDNSVVRVAVRLKHLLRVLSPKYVGSGFRRRAVAASRGC
jgi:hypothetical protein